MIPLIVALALVFAWAVIATAVAIALNLRATTAEQQAGASWSLVNELQDRLQSSSLSEYTANRRIAMEPFSTTPTHTYRYDDTGLVRDIADPEDEDQ